MLDEGLVTDDDGDRQSALPSSESEETSPDALAPVCAQLSINPAATSTMLVTANIVAAVEAAKGSPLFSETCAGVSLSFFLTPTPSRKQRMRPIVYERVYVEHLRREARGELRRGSFATFYLGRSSIKEPLPPELYVLVCKLPHTGRHPLDAASDALHACGRHTEGSALWGAYPPLQGKFDVDAACSAANRAVRHFCGEVLPLLPHWQSCNLYN